MHSGLFFWIIDNPEKAIPLLEKLDGSYDTRLEVIKEMRLEEVKSILNPKRKR